MESCLSNVVSDITAVFSDIDGTLAHYAKSLVSSGYARLQPEEIDALLWPPTPTNEVEELLNHIFSSAQRQERFHDVPFQFWRHTETQKVIKTYELYNLSLTGAVISENTILLTELLQQSDCLYDGLVATAPSKCLPVLFTLITGARSSTYLRRRQGGSLPMTAYDSSEGGGKLWCRLRDPTLWLAGQQSATSDIFLPNGEIPPCDETWTARFSDVTGYTTDAPSQCDNNAPLWQVASLLEAQGFAIDRIDYDTSFLVNLKASPCVTTDAEYSPRLFASAEDAEAYLKDLFAQELTEQYGLELFVNLGKAQVNAVGSGKKGVMNYVMDVMNEVNTTAHKRFAAPHAVALFDDHNDLPFAEACGAGMLPSVAHEEVLAHPEWTGEQKRWFRPPFDGLLGSEWALSQIVLFKRHQAQPN